MMSIMLTPLCERVAIIAFGDSQMNLPMEWKQTLRMFQLAMIVILYIYSVRARSFREDNNNFQDN